MGFAVCQASPQSALPSLVAIFKAITIVRHIWIVWLTVLAGICLGTGHGVYGHGVYGRSQGLVPTRPTDLGTGYYHQGIPNHRLTGEAPV